MNEKSASGTPRTSARRRAMNSVAWLLAQPGVTSPIIGPRTLAQLDDNAAALDVTLPQEVLDTIDTLVPPGRSTWG